MFWISYGRRCGNFVSCSNLCLYGSSPSITKCYQWWVCVKEGHIAVAAKDSDPSWQDLYVAVVAQGLVYLLFCVIFYDISVIYKTAHSCTCGLKKKVDLSSCSYPIDFGVLQLYSPSTDEGLPFLDYYKKPDPLYRKVGFNVGRKPRPQQ